MVRIVLTMNCKNSYKHHKIYGYYITKGIGILCCQGRNLVKTMNGSFLAYEKQLIRGGYLSTQATYVTINMQMS